MSLLFVVVVFGSFPSVAETRVIHIRNCSFSPQPRYADPNDNVTWRYEEGGCSPDNHRIVSWGSPPEDFDSGPCSGRASIEPTCLNTAPGRSPSFTFRPTKPGNYPFYCPIHGQVSSDNTSCDGMCGLLKVNALPSGGGSTATASATATATATKKSSASPTVRASGTASVSPGRSSSLSPTASATASALAKKGGGGGGAGRVVIAVAAVALLGACALLVWRAFIAQST